MTLRACKWSKRAFLPTDVGGTRPGAPLWNYDPHHGMLMSAMLVFLGEFGMHTTPGVVFLIPVPESEDLDAPNLSLPVSYLSLRNTMGVLGDQGMQRGLDILHDEVDTSTGAEECIMQLDDIAMADMVKEKGLTHGHTHDLQGTWQGVSGREEEGVLGAFVLYCDEGQQSQAAAMLHV